MILWHLILFFLDLMCSEVASWRYSNPTHKLLLKLIPFREHNIITTCPLSRTTLWTGVHILLGDRSHITSSFCCSYPASFTRGYSVEVAAIPSSIVWWRNMWAVPWHVTWHVIPLLKSKVLQITDNSQL